MGVAASRSIVVQTPLTHVRHPVPVVVVNKGRQETWHGNLTLLATSSSPTTSKKTYEKDDLDRSDHTGATYCSSSEDSSSSSEDSSSALFNGSYDGDSVALFTNLNATNVLYDDLDNIVYSDLHHGIFSLFQHGDGSAEDPDGIPDRFLTMAKQDRGKALKAVQKTIQWREEEGMNELLNEPHVNYDICKQVVPHLYIGRGLDGHAVYVQQPALFSIDQMKRNGLQLKDMLRHAIYVQEYLWQIVEADNPRALITNIIDVGDLRMGHLRQKEQLQFLKEMAMTFDTHFPMRGAKTFIVNAPKWFHLLYQLIKPLLRESTTAMVEICTKGKKQDAILRAHLGEATSQNLPGFCLSDHSKKTTATSKKELPFMEEQLRAYVMKRIEVNGRTMRPVVP